MSFSMYVFYIKIGFPIGGNSWIFLFFIYLRSCFVFLRQGLPLSLRLECSGMIIAHCSLNLLGSNSLPPQPLRVARTTDVHHHAQLIFVFLVETGFHHVDQDGLDLLTSWSTRLGLPKCWDYRREPPRLANQILTFITCYSKYITHWISFSLNCF